MAVQMRGRRRGDGTWGRWGRSPRPSQAPKVRAAHIVRWLLRTSFALFAAEQAEAALRGLLRLPEPADYVADWSPAIPPSQLLLGLTQQQPQQPQSSDSRSADSDSEGDGKASGPAGASPGPGAKAGRPSGAAAAAAAAAAAGVRTVRAVAGPSGVRTSVPSLAVLCMEVRTHTHTHTH